MNQLEKYIKDNRAAFDTEVPSLKVWSEIDKRLPEKKIRRFNFWKTYSIAASLLVLIIAGGMFFTKNRPLEQSEETAFQAIPQEFTEAMNYYQKQIEIKKAILTKYYPDKTVIADIDNLDHSFEELKKELASAPRGSEKQIVKALIKNYQTKLNILELVLEKTETVKPVKPPKLQTTHKISL